MHPSAPESTRVRGRRKGKATGGYFLCYPKCLFEASEPLRIRLCKTRLERAQATNLTCEYLYDSATIVVVLVRISYI